MPPLEVTCQSHRSNIESKFPSSLLYHTAFGCLPQLASDHRIITSGKIRLGVIPKEALRWQLISESLGSYFGEFYIAHVNDLRWLSMAQFVSTEWYISRRDEVRGG